jgi:hypothetical protein
MTDLSPAAQAVISAATQAAYGLDPADVPNEAARMASIIAVALRAAADQVVPVESELVDGHLRYEKRDPIREEFLAIANELEIIND